MAINDDKVIKTVGTIILNIRANMPRYGVQGIGVYSGAVPSPGGGMDVNLTALVGFVGASPKTESSGTVTLSASDATNPRLDLIIYDKSASAFAVVTGTPAAITPSSETDPLKFTAPVPPTPETHAADLAHDDIVICIVSVPANLATILDSHIFDMRQLFQKWPSQILTTAGDSIQGGSSGVPERLAIGTARQIQRVNSGATALEFVTNKKPIWVQPHYASGTGAVLAATFAGHATAKCVDAQTNQIYMDFVVPSDFTAITKAIVAVVAVATGNIYRKILTKAGAAGEDLDADSGEVTLSTLAVTIRKVKEDNVSAALTALAAGDHVGLEWQRQGGHGNDTIGDDVHVLGFLLEYE